MNSLLILAAEEPSPLAVEWVEVVIALVVFAILFFAIK